MKEFSCAFFYGHSTTFLRHHHHPALSSGTWDHVGRIRWTVFPVYTIVRGVSIVRRFWMFGRLVRVGQVRFVLRKQTLFLRKQSLFYVPRYFNRLFIRQVRVIRENRPEHTAGDVENRTQNQRGNRGAKNKKLRALKFWTVNEECLPDNTYLVVWQPVDV